jgi:hypothetical protein
MTIDLTGGMGDEREYVFATKPDDPEMRESVNAWIWDKDLTVGLPRVGVEAVGDHWDKHDVQVNIACADGRVLNIFAPGEKHDPSGADGKPRVLGAGPLSFELVEPFKRWRVRIDGTANETSTQAQIDGWMPGPSEGAGVPVALDLELTSAAPPWEVGTLREEAGYVIANQEEGDLMGGPRFEQLFRATGRLRLGDDVHEIDGGGNRIRRTGVRRLAAFRGHVWQSSVFPSGRAFGVLTYPERTDGKPTLNEAFLFEGAGDLVPARVVKAPWLQDLEPKGQDVSVVIETEGGTTHAIKGQTALSTFMVMGPDVGGGFHLQQAIVEYTLDGETAPGMIERSRALG